jgi:ParB-like chromosome segregation protein Spo0J
MKHVEFAHIPLAKLQEFPGNAKEHDLDELRRSLRKGQFQPIIVREHEGVYTVLSGHGTTEAARLEDWETVECKVIECSDDEALWINLAANRIGERAGYHDESLAALLEQLDGDYVGTGWEADDLDDLLSALDQVAETPYVATEAQYAETPEQAAARAELGSGESLAARGIRETVIILPQDDHDELHRHLAGLRSSLDANGDLTNGEILLRAARGLKLTVAARAEHGKDCDHCNHYNHISSPV